MKRAFVLAAVLCLAGCGGASAPSKLAAKPAAPAPLSPPAPPAAPGDPLGPRPEPEIPAAWKPPTPLVYTMANGVTVWLLERHALPVVAATVIVPTGASSDPKGQAGLAFAAANMLDEGAGKLGALEFARAVDQLGAHIHSDGSSDTSYVQLSVLKRNLAPAVGLLGDAVARPRFDEKEWRRVHDLWVNDLRQRPSDPSELAKVLRITALYGTEHPYGHPADGFLSTASKVQLADAKKFYVEAWRPDRATIAVVGDVTKAELDPLLEASLGSWKKPASAPLPIVTPPAPSGTHPKLVLIDRADAPQSVISFIRTGMQASDPSLPALSRANKALGGTFTSRLTQDLREEHGWTYGVSSRVSLTRGIGTIQTSAAVITEKTAEALRAMLNDIDDFAKKGLTDAEVSKTRVLARSEVVEQYETVEAASMHLARDAALGLPADYEAKASEARDAADRTTLDKLAATYFDGSDGVIVIVGPRAKLEEPLAKAGFPASELRDVEGRPITATKTAR